MNHGSSGSRRGSSGGGGRRGSRGRSPASEQWVIRQNSEIPVTVDRSLNESSGNKGRGSRGRGTINSYGRGSVYNSPVQVYVKKSNAGLVEEEDNLVDSTKQLGDGADLKLSGDNNVVSTSIHKVEDHNSVQRDGGAVNSSNESNTRPFDLFLWKKAIGLKPSLLELNRDRRNESKGYTGIVIRPGMVLLKNYLSINDQVMILNKCRELGLGEGGFYQPGYRNGALLHLKMLCLGKNWDPETYQYGETRTVDGSSPPKIPVEFSQLVGKAVNESQSLVATNSMKTNGEVGMPSISPDICIVNFYTSTGRLGLHQDKDESQNSIRKGVPVVSFSIGDSAEFLYGDQRGDDKAEMLVLESGDVLLFGGKSRNIFHGVRSIHKDTAPKVLVQQINLRPGRLNLTFRQY